MITSCRGNQIMLVRDKILWISVVWGRKKERLQRETAGTRRRAISIFGVSDDPEYYWAHKMVEDPSLLVKNIVLIFLLKESSVFLECYLLEGCSKVAALCLPDTLGFLPLNCPTCCCSSSWNIRWPKKKKKKRKKWYMFLLMWRLMSYLCLAGLKNLC